MLGKLFKYEFKACSRVILPVFGAAIITSLLASLLTLISPSANVMNPGSQAANVFIGFISSLIMIAFVALIYAALLVSFIYSLIRFRKSLLGSEGYLMNTLPVSALSNVVAKMLCAFVFQVLSVLTIVICMLIFVLVATKTSLATFFSGFSEIAYAFAQLGIDGWVFFVLLLITMIVGTIKSNAMIYAAMAIGHSFNGKKRLKSIGIFILASIVENILISVFLSTGALNNVNVETAMSAFNLLFGLIIIVSIIFAVGYTALASYFISKRLNLE